MESMLGKLAIAIVRFYQTTISPLTGASCRYVPTCSEYMVQAIQKYGLLRGGWKGLRRVVRCHPFCRGGYDPP